MLLRYSGVDNLPTAATQLHYFNLNLHAVRNTTLSSDDEEVVVAIVYRYTVGNTQSGDTYTTPWFYTILNIPSTKETRASSEMPQTLLYPQLSVERLQMLNTTSPTIIDNTPPIRPNTTMPAATPSTLHSPPTLPSLPTNRTVVQPPARASEHNRARTSSTREKAYPVFPTTVDYPTIGWNTTWFLLQHNPTSAYL
uniref:Uncharacterized protein n=1 Tax=Lygus hesperus TaxID=30085 RepID=A0A146LLQ1_LYGHE